LEITLSAQTQLAVDPCDSKRLTFCFEELKVSHSAFFIISESQVDVFVRDSSFSDLQTVFEVLAKVVDPGSDIGIQLPLPLTKSRLVKHTVALLGVPLSLNSACLQEVKEAVHFPWDCQVSLLSSCFLISILDKSTSVQAKAVEI
jgi:hypothetical protein